MEEKAALTVSFQNGSDRARTHNNRVRCPKNANPNLGDRNIIFIDKALGDAYEEIFGDAVREYNARQNRPERQIRSYLSKIEGDAKKHTVYECIACIGDHDTIGIMGENAELARKALIRFTEEWDKRNPHLRLIGAYLHGDEENGTVHVHLDYVPVADGYKKGMTIQNGLDKALRQQGFHVVKKADSPDQKWNGTPQQQWQESERVALAAIAREIGLTVTTEHDPLKRRQHESTPIYQANKDRDRAEHEAAIREKERAEAERDQAIEEKRTVRRQTKQEQKRKVSLERQNAAAGAILEEKTAAADQAQQRADQAQELTQRAVAIIKDEGEKYKEAVAQREKIENETAACMRQLEGLKVSVSEQLATLQELQQKTEDTRLELLNADEANEAIESTNRMIRQFQKLALSLNRMEYGDSMPKWITREKPRFGPERFVVNPNKVNDLMVLLSAAADDSTERDEFSFGHTTHIKSKLQELVDECQNLLVQIYETQNGEMIRRFQEELEQAIAGETLLRQKLDRKDAIIDKLHEQINTLQYENELLRQENEQYVAFMQGHEFSDGSTVWDEYLAWQAGEYAPEPDEQEQQPDLSYDDVEI